MRAIASSSRALVSGCAVVAAEQRALERVRGPAGMLGAGPGEKRGLFGRTAGFAMIVTTLLPLKFRGPTPVKPLALARGR